MPRPRYGIAYLKDSDGIISGYEYHIFSSLKARKAFENSIDDKHHKYLMLKPISPKDFQIATSSGWRNRPNPAIVDHTTAD